MKAFLSIVTLAQLAEVASSHARRRRGLRNAHEDAWRAEVRRMLSHRDD
jgi:hypothetical protein